MHILEHLNFPLGTSETVMSGGFGWRSWCESQSRVGSGFLPGESVSVSCFLAGTGSGGLNRGNPTCWWGKLQGAVLHSPIQTHTHTHMDALLPTYSKYTCACTSLVSSVWDSLSGRDNNLKCICSLKIFALFHSVTLADIHFPSFVSECTAWSVVIHVCACDGLCLFHKKNCHA